MLHLLPIIKTKEENLFKAQVHLHILLQHLPCHLHFHHPINIYILYIPFIVSWSLLCRVTARIHWPYQKMYVCIWHCISLSCILTRLEMGNVQGILASLHRVLFLVFCPWHHFNRCNFYKGILYLLLEDETSSSSGHNNNPPSLEVQMMILNPFYILWKD